MNVQEIYIDQIDEPAHAMRADIDRDSIFTLADSIKAHGLINPITVRSKGERFEVVAGHRRFLAHRYGGLPKIKCVVRVLSDAEAAAVMASENYDREDTNPIDDAHNVVQLLTLYKDDIAAVCKIVRRGEQWVKDRVTVHNMPDYMKDALKKGELKIGVALTLNEITDDIDREACVKMAISQGATGVQARYWLSQWQMGIFGHAVGKIEPEDNTSGGGRRIVLLRCALSGREYPAEEMRSVLIHSSMMAFVDASREVLKNETPHPELAGGEDQYPAPEGAVAPAASMGGASEASAVAAPFPHLASER